MPTLLMIALLTASLVALDAPTSSIGLAIVGEESTYHEHRRPRRRRGRRAGAEERPAGGTGAGDWAGVGHRQSAHRAGRLYRIAGDQHPAAHALSVPRRYVARPLSRWAGPSDVADAARDVHRARAGRESDLARAALDPRGNATRREARDHDH